MKNYKIQIEDSEVLFFKKLMDKLSFIKYEEIPTISEPRIYPGANFAIHGSKNQPEKKSDTTSEKKAMHMNPDPKKIKKDAMADIRDVILKIDQMRNK